MKFLTGLLAMLLPILSGAQSPPVRALSVGDTVPDIVFNHVINYKDTTARLSDFKGKLVILDFWSSWCSSCIALFPHLDSMQRLINEDLQIILVNTKSVQFKDDERKINGILKSTNERTGGIIDLPVVYNCPELDNYFPSIEIPHEVWIDRSGKVVGITRANQVTQKNIQALIDGQHVSMPLKIDRFDVDIRKPLFINANGGDGKEILYRSMVTGYLDGFGNGTGTRTRNGNYEGLYAVNQSLYSLTKTAYSTEITFPENQVILEVKDHQKFRPQTNDNTSDQYLFSYELMIPPTKGYTQLLREMQSDLKRFFNISIKLEKRKIKCLVLIDSIKVPSVAVPQKTGYALEANTSIKYIYKSPPDRVVYLLNLFSKTPVINEMQSKPDLFIDLPNDLADIKGLIYAFKKAGVLLKEEYRDIEVALITDK